MCLYENSGHFRLSLLALNFSPAAHFLVPCDVRPQCAGLGIALGAAVRTADESCGSLCSLFMYVCASFGSVLAETKTPADSAFACHPGRVF